MKIFPVHYFPPVSWFAQAIQCESMVLEQHQHYRKQGLQNRTRIQGANKIQGLSIPVKRTGEETPLHESRISYEQNWQKDHWRGITSAYRNSPYFEYYEDRIGLFFESQEPSLLQFNLSILNTLWEILDHHPQMQLTESFQPASAYERDFRRDFDGAGKMPDWFEAVPYTQVFRSFEPDLSILDLLFNEGPGARSVLEKSLK